MKGWQATRPTKVATPGQLPRWPGAVLALAIAVMVVILWGTSQGHAWAYVLFMGMSSFLWALAALSIGHNLGQTFSVRIFQGPLRACYVALAFLSYVPVAAHAVATFGLAEGSESAGGRAMLAVVAAFALGKLLTAFDLTRTKIVALKEAGLQSMSAHERLAEAARDAHHIPPRG